MEQSIHSTIQDTLYRKAGQHPQHRRHSISVSSSKFFSDILILVILGGLHFLNTLKHWNLYLEIHNAELTVVNQMYYITFPSTTPVHSVSSSIS